VTKQVLQYFPLTPFYKKCGVVQLFINNDECSTRYSIANFPSFLNPIKATESICSISLYNAEGTFLFTRKLTMKSFGSLDIDIASLDNSWQLPQLGMAVIQVIPKHLLWYPNPVLWHTISHFFTTFVSKYGSISGVVHPQSLLGEESDSMKQGEWISNLSLQCGDLESADIYQINPCKIPKYSNLLVYGNNKIICDRKRYIPAFGVCVTRLNRDDFGNEESIRLGVIGMTGKNSKPLIMFRTISGSISVVHS
jgi:hypothetical protein